MPKKSQVDELQAQARRGMTPKGMTETDIIVDGMMEDLLRIAAIPVVAKAPQDSQYTAGPQPVLRSY